jgi:transcriptional regulator with XRE-family HTH domain
MNLDPKSAQERLSSNRNLANRFGKPDQSVSENSAGVGESSVEVVKFRDTSREGKPNLPVFVRTTMAILAEGEPQSSVAKEFGVSQMTVSKAKNGKTKTDRSEIDMVRNAVQDKALERLMVSLNLINDDKLSSSSAKELSGIAANMAKVVDRTAPKGQLDGANVQLLVYAPQIKAEDNYRVIEQE